MAISEMAKENGFYNQAVELFKKYDMTIGEGYSTRFEHKTGLLYAYLSMYDRTFSVYFGGNVVKRHQYISYHYNQFEYDKLEQRIKRMLKKVAEKSIIIERRKEAEQEITNKLINYLDATCENNYEVLFPYDRGAMKVKIDGEEYYVNSYGTVKVNLAGKRMVMPVHLASQLIKQASQFAVDTYEDVAGKYQPDEEEVA